MCKLQSTLEVVADGLCDANEKPPDKEICNDDPCEVSLFSPFVLKLNLFIKLTPTHIFKQLTANI